MRDAGAFEGERVAFMKEGESDVGLVVHAVLAGIFIERGGVELDFCGGSGLCGEWKLYQRQE